MNLRFVIRDGKKILQYESSEFPALSSSWKDVPLVEEPRKPRDYWICYYSEGNVATIQNTPTFHPQQQTPLKVVHVREVMEGES